MPYRKLVVQSPIVVHETEAQRTYQIALRALDRLRAVVQARWLETGRQRVSDAAERGAMSLVFSSSPETFEGHAEEKLFIEAAHADGYRAGYPQQTVTVGPGPHVIVYWDQL